MTLKFIPPKPVGQYALYIEREYGPAVFKVYSDLGPLKNAFYNRVGYNYKENATRVNAKVLEMVHGEWYVLFDVPKGTKKEDIPWMRVRHVTHRYGYWKEVKEGTEGAFKRINSRPMTREEYADWRIKVELERRGIVD